MRVKSWVEKAARGKEEACGNSLSYFSDFPQQEEAGKELNTLNVITVYSAPDRRDLLKLESTYLITNTAFPGFLQAGDQSVDVRAKSPVHLELLLHTTLLRGQGLEIKKKDIKQQDFNVLTPQSLPTIWRLHRPGVHTCVHPLAHLFHGTSLFHSFVSAYV